MMKAPKGGTVSHVNGQFYNGGEFVPDHGLYCGKGRNRVTLSAMSDMHANAEARGYALGYSEKLDRFELRKFGQVYFSGKSLARLMSVIS